MLGSGYAPAVGVTLEKGKTVDSTTSRKIYGLEDARLKWGIVLLNAMSHKRMDEAERMIAIIDKKLERLRNN